MMCMDNIEDFRKSREDTEIISVRPCSGVCATGWTQQCHVRGLDCCEALRIRARQALCRKNNAQNFVRFEYVVHSTSRNPKNNWSFSSTHTRIQIRDVDRRIQTALNSPVDCPIFPLKSSVWSWQYPEQWNPSTDQCQPASRAASDFFLTKSMRSSLEPATKSPAKSRWCLGKRWNLMTCSLCSDDSHKPRYEMDTLWNGDVICPFSTNHTKGSLFEKPTHLYQVPWHQTLSVS